MSATSSQHARCSRGDEPESARLASTMGASKQLMFSSETRGSMISHIIRELRTTGHSVHRRRGSRAARLDRRHSKLPAGCLNLRDSAHVSWSMLHAFFPGGSTQGDACRRRLLVDPRQRCLSERAESKALRRVHIGVHDLALFGRVATCPGCGQ